MGQELLQAACGIAVTADGSGTATSSVWNSGNCRWVRNCYKQRVWNSGNCRWVRNCYKQRVWNSGNCRWVRNFQLLIQLCLCFSVLLLWCPWRHAYESTANLFFLTCASSQFMTCIGNDHTASAERQKQTLVVCNCVSCCRVAVVVSCHFCQLII